MAGAKGSGSPPRISAKGSGSPPRISVAIAGSTGSIGCQALEVVAATPERFEVVALAASGSAEVVSAQAHAFRPTIVGMADSDAAAELDLPAGTQVVVGEEVAEALAGSADVMLNAVVGFAGLPFTLAALDAGCRLALANKESLVAAGSLLSALRASAHRRRVGGLPQAPQPPPPLTQPDATGFHVVPVDSEHAALHQCLAGTSAREISRLLVTASGGPFRGRSRDELRAVTPADALAHPTWTMGAKVTIDSSTLMNKGLEVIEAHELFDVPYDAIEVVVHPQSIVHSMVETRDGSTMAQLSLPDMRLPIGYALGYPERIDVAYGRIDWTKLARLEFETPDTKAFECLSLAYEAGRAGGSAPAWLNAANEVAVAAFLAGRIPWLGIAEVVGGVLGEWDGGGLSEVADVLEADAGARRRAGARVEGLAAA